MTLLTIALRFVPYDQWLLTHLDDACKVRQAKHWFLSKCNLAHPPPSHRRPVSPITFAPSVRASTSLDSLDDGYNEDDEHSDHDQPVPAKYAPPSPATQPGSTPLVEQYTLVAFSTGSILEDEFALSWYNLRPYELLEMHPVGTIAPLQRGVLAEYIQPYFQAKVRVLRAVWNYRSGRFEVPGIDALSDFKFAPKSSPEKRRKAKVDWKARWIVISQGILSICKGHASNPPLQQFPLASMRALHGADALERVFAIVTEPRIVCIKFCRRPVSLASVASSPPSLPASPMSERTRTSNQGTPDPQEDRPSGDYAHIPNDDDEGDWIVLDMLDDHAFSSILRILHRQACCPISSSFIPASNVITVSHPYTPSPTAASFASYDTIPYPEWRVNTVENARKAGMGDVGKPMAWVIWTDKGLGDTLMGNIRRHRQAFSREMQYKYKIPPWNIYAGSDDDDESDDESEMEWEGWMRDLDRQNQIKKTRSKQASLAASPLPSPPLSEASTSSPRVRSPSLSYAQYPNIGNVMKNTTVSTVSVGAVPYSRRRSTTLTAEMAPPKDKELLPSMAARANARTVSTSACLPSSPRTIIRHFHSSSNLRVSSYGSDAAESPGQPAASSPAKRQSAFMRGMSLRAGKLVRGLESAIDFVDDK